MRYQKMLLAVSACFVMTAFPAVAKEHRSKTQAAKSATAKNKERTRVAATSSRNRTKSSGPARQSAPTPERYMEVQQALTEKGFYTGAVDGNWNAECVDALKRFQAAHNLESDGKLGSLSLIGLGLGPKREEFPEQLPGRHAVEPAAEPNQ